MQRIYIIELNCEKHICGTIHDIRLRCKVLFGSKMI